MRAPPTIALCTLALAGLAPAAPAPPPRNPLIPMGAITGRPDERVVEQTLRAYRAVGIDQYLIYPRSGCELDYLGEDWMQVCEWFCKHARRLDMALWLYDEFNWPSGACKGRVPAERPEFQARSYAVYKQPDGSFRWTIAHAPAQGVPYTCGDNYSFKAMERFMELTHAQYEHRLRPYFGSTIRGIFTDEPGHPPARLDLDGTPALVFRYFDGLDAEYQATTGRPFRPDVEAYLNDPRRDTVWPVHAELLGRRFRRAFFDPIRAWCDRMGILSTGHMIAENSTAKAVQMNGNPLHVLKGLSLPGLDEIGTRVDPARIEWVTMAIAQHAIGRRHNGGLAELFALGPSDLTHAVHRQMIWLCALHKVDRYLLAIAPLDARGSAEKSGYLNSFTPMQPWFPALTLLRGEAQRAARCAAKPVGCDVAIRYPQTDAARLAHKGKEHPTLADTLRRFSASHQITYDLCEEQEPCKHPIVFSFAGPELREERSGRIFKTADEAAGFARAARPPAVRVEREDGTLAEDVLVRHYQDDSVAVLALGSTAPGRLRLVRQDAAPLPFELPARGVFLDDGRARPSAPAIPRVEPLPADTRFQVALDKCNAHRLAFGTSGTVRVRVAQPIPDARIAVRRYPAPWSITLDGQPVRADAPCNTLRQGYNELCGQSAPFKIEPGEHVFAIAQGDPDTNYYLPVAWLTGPFAVKDATIVPAPKTLAPGPLWEIGLGDFAGTITCTTQVRVPQHTGETRLRLDTGGLYTSVSIDGRPLGERAWAPFEWSIPADTRNKAVELKVTIHTSIAPMLGNPKAPGTQWTQKFWVPPPNPRPAVGLVTLPEWLLF